MQDELTMKNMLLNMDNSGNQSNLDISQDKSFIDNKDKLMAVMDPGANFITLMLPDSEGKMIKQQVKITPSDASVLQDNSMLDTS